MVDVIRVQKLNHVNLQLDCDRGVAMELDEAFSFFVPGHQYMPSFKNKMWDGRIKLFNRNNYQLPVGLYSSLEAFARKHGYEIELIEGPVGYPDEKNDITVEEIFNFTQKLNYRTKGNKIDIRDYQFEAVFKGIRDKRRILLSPTGSGKSLIIYTLVRWYLDNFDDKAIIVVPTTSLVEQMFSDFKDYSSEDDSFDVEQECHKIFSGREKENVKQRVIITTWQSIYKLQGKWFDPFGMVIGDECHQFKAKSLTSIMNKCRNAEYRFGTTGTLDDSEVHELVLTGLFGKVKDVTTTRKLQDEGTLAKLDIELLVLKHSEKTRRHFGRQTYQDEIDYIIRHEKRNTFVRKLALDQRGNTLVLFQFVKKHGKPLYQDILNHAHENRKVFFVSGEVETADREAIRKIVESQNDAIIVASMGVFSTGINIRIYIISYFQVQLNQRSESYNPSDEVFVSLIMGKTQN